MDSFVTEETIKKLANRGVDMLRLPIGDWTLDPYGPYVGCMDGAEERIDWLYDTCHKYGIDVMMDVHTAKGSQNGFDNSGMANGFEWIDETHFKHWPLWAGEWMGEWNYEEQKYNSINWERIQWSIDNSEALIKRWGDHPAFAQFQPINEPWGFSDFEVLFHFYREVRKILTKYNPDATFVFHDAFTYDAGLWNQLFEDTDKVAMDHHHYQAFMEPNGMKTADEFCGNYYDVACGAVNFKYDVYFGEWSLATDACCMWLGGFNDANNEPQFPC